VSGVFSVGGASLRAFLITFALLRGTLITEIEQKQRHKHMADERETSRPSHLSVGGIAQFVIPARKSGTQRTKRSIRKEAQSRYKLCQSVRGDRAYDEDLQPRTTSRRKQTARTDPTRRFELRIKERSRTDPWKIPAVVAGECCARQSEFQGGPGAYTQNNAKAAA